MTAGGGYWLARRQLVIEKAIKDFPWGDTNVDATTEEGRQWVSTLAAHIIEGLATHVGQVVADVPDESLIVTCVDARFVPGGWEFVFETEDSSQEITISSPSATAYNVNQEYALTFVPQTTARAYTRLPAQRRES